MIVDIYLLSSDLREGKIKPSLPACLTEAPACLGEEVAQMADGQGLQTTNLMVNPSIR